MAKCLAGWHSAGAEGEPGLTLWPDDHGLFSMKHPLLPPCRPSQFNWDYMFSRTAKASLNAAEGNLQTTSKQTHLVACSCYLVCVVTAETLEHVAACQCCTNPPVDFTFHLTLICEQWTEMFLLCLSLWEATCSKPESWLSTMFWRSTRPETLRCFRRGDVRNRPVSALCCSTESTANRATCSETHVKGENEKWVLQSMMARIIEIATLLHTLLCKVDRGVNMHLHTHDRRSLRAWVLAPLTFLPPH